MARLAILSALLVLLGGSVAAAGPAPPTFSAVPVITGTATEGQTLMVSTGTWSGVAPIAYRFQWYRCGYAGSPCAAVLGATASSYPLTAEDVGHTLRATVTATDANGSNSATAAPSATVTAPNTTEVVAAQEQATAIRVEDVLAPNAMSFGDVSAPSTVRTRAPFKVRVHLVDDAGLDVVGALVSVVSVPARAVTPTAAFTNDEGWAQLTLKPTKHLDLTRSSLALLLLASDPTREQGGALASRSVRVAIKGPAKPAKRAKKRG